LGFSGIVPFIMWMAALTFPRQTTVGLMSEVAY
jgi:hypothetical protein